MLNLRYRTVPSSVLLALNLFQERYMKHWRPGLGLGTDQHWTRTLQAHIPILVLPQNLPGPSVISSFGGTKVVEFLIYLLKSRSRQGIWMGVFSFLILFSLLTNHKGNGQRVYLWHLLPVTESFGEKRNGFREEASWKHTEFLSIALFWIL